MIPFWLIGIVVGTVVLSGGSGKKDTRVEDARRRAEERMQRSNAVVEDMYAQTRQQAAEITQELTNSSQKEITDNLQKMQEGLLKLCELKQATSGEENKNRLQSAINSLSEKISMIKVPHQFQ